MIFLLPENKHQSFLKAGSIVFAGHSQALSNYQNSKFVISLQYLKKKGKDEVDFLQVDKH